MSKRETLFSDPPLPPETPWWRDDLKVIASAIERAKVNPAARRRLRTALKEWAASDENFRRELAAELNALGQARRGNIANPEWTKELLIATIDIWRKQGDTLATACGRIAESPVLAATFGDNVDSIASRYQKARRRTRDR